MKRRTHIPRVNPMVWAQLIAARQDTDPETVTEVMTKLHDAFIRLRDGSTDDELFDRLASCMNVGLIRAEQIDAVCVTPMVAARDALIRCDGIRGRHGRYGFDGPGLHAIVIGLEVYEEMLRNSTPHQMCLALTASIGRMSAQIRAEKRA